MATTVERSIRFNSGRLHGEIEQVLKVLAHTKKIMSDCRTPESMQEVAANLADIAAFMSAKAELTEQFEAWIRCLKPTARLAALKDDGEPTNYSPLNAAMDEYEVAYEKVQFI